MRKIAIFHWGELSVHSYYLAAQLAKEGISIDFFLYTPRYANKNPFIKTVMALLETNVTLVQLTCSRLENAIVKANYFLRLFHLHFPLLYINPVLPYRTRRNFRQDNYSATITISPSSLYWLSRVSRNALKTNLHYSLEIERITDPGIHPSSPLYSFIKSETKLLSQVKGLIIQDTMRAGALLEGVNSSTLLRLIYLPVSVPGEIIEVRSDYLYEKLDIAKNAQVLLYFGAIYQERKIDELVEAVEGFISNKWVLVLHGAGKFSHIIKDHSRVKASNELLEFHEISKLTSSATIGISFYDNDWPNTRLTAFSSEKIARYLRAGIPFIAFKNESYDKLRSEYCCCELIKDMSELENAAEHIMKDYQHYRTQSFKAYNHYYNIANTIKPLSEFIKNEDMRS